MERDLAWLLGPITVGDFFGRYFEREMFHLTDRGEHFYDPAFSLPDIDRIIRQSPEFVASHLRYSRLGDGGRRNPFSAHAEIPTPVNSDNLGSAVRAAFAAGYSLIFDDILVPWWPLARLARAIESVILGQVTASMFFTPPDSQGVPAHFDGFDVLVMQISGCKDWKVYQPRPGGELPIGPKPLGDIELGDPLAYLTMRPGDLLYLPRGFIHEARSSEMATMHVTVGLHPYRWYELLADAIEALAEEDVSLRQSVPISVCRAIAGGATAGYEAARGQLVRHLQHCLSHATLEAPIVRHARRFIDSLQPIGLDGFVPASDAFDEQTPIVKKPGMICCAYDDDGKAVIGFPGGSVRGPMAIRPLLEFIARTETPFRLADLPGELSAHSKSVLVCRLIREGLLRVAGSPAQ